jgi:alginate O-acetyltransferase complex protein AlgI
MIAPEWYAVEVAVTLLAAALLTIATWRRSTRPAIRAVLVIVASASLCLAITGNLFTLAFLGLDVILVAITWRIARSGWIKATWGIVWIVVLVLALVLAKLPQRDDSVLNASPATWIGISYFIFRLIHVAFDARRDRLGNATLSETLVYALHPTTLIAGPIDRIQHSVLEQRCEREDAGSYVTDGLWRIFVGLFKKIALANLFASFVTAYDVTRQGVQPVGIAWLWLLAYSFYLYFDFAAYSDMAIGAGRLMGLRLPENFANPYLQPTLARFWQTWHITLSTWLRDYIFFPLSRMLLRRSGSRFTTPTMFASHVTTMVGCGLWHGLTPGFAAWGLWHGLGLFVNSQVPALRRRFGLPVLPSALSVVLTFAFVTLGWVFFNHDLSTSLMIFGRLLGMS